MILSSPNVSMEEWYLLIPNNVKHRYSFPTSRISVRRKSIYKRKTKQNISFKVFSTISDMVEKMIINGFEYDDFIKVDEIK